MTVSKVCLDCKKNIAKRHSNAKRCEKCAAIKRKKPIGKLTDKQIRQMKKLSKRGFFAHEIAEKIGTSRVNLTRYARDHGFSFIAGKKWLSNPQFCREVCEYYSLHGFEKTQKKYKNISIRSIIERYSQYLKPRQIRWTDKQKFKLLQFAGLIGHKIQAEYFKRPNAYDGSIKSVWQKVFKASERNINGLVLFQARHLVKYGCPCYETNFSEQRNFCRKIILWIDMEKHMRDDLPNHIKMAISAMADFQRWLHGKNVMRNIMKIFELANMEKRV